MRKWTWGNICRGDDVIVTNDRGHQSHGVVVSVGPMWITVQINRRRERFDASNGVGEYGQRVHTRQTLADVPRRKELVNVLNHIAWQHVPMSVLEAAVAALDAEAGGTSRK